jgi:hypothetical protein
LEVDDAAMEAGDAAMEAGDAAMEVGDVAMEVGDVAKEGADVAKEVGDMVMGGSDMAKEVGDVVIEVCDVMMEVGDVGMAGDDMGMAGYYMTMPEGGVETSGKDAAMKGDVVAIAFRDVRRPGSEESEIARAMATSIDLVIANETIAVEQIVPVIKTTGFALIVPAKKTGAIFAAIYEAIGFQSA